MILSFIFAYVAIFWPSMKQMLARKSPKMSKNWEFFENFLKHFLKSLETNCQPPTTIWNHFNFALVVHWSVAPAKGQLTLPEFKNEQLLTLVTHRIITPFASADSHGTKEVFQKKSHFWSQLKLFWRLRTLALLFGKRQFIHVIFAWLLQKLEKLF